MFLSDAQTLQSLADTLQTTLASVGATSYLSNVNTTSHTWAYNRIVEALSQRGYTPPQIAAWDEGAEFERELTLWRVLTQSANFLGVPETYVKTLDRREELATLSVITAGSIVDPLGTAGQPSGDRQSGWSKECALPGGDPVFRHHHDGGW